MSSFFYRLTKCLDDIIQISWRFCTIVLAIYLLNLVLVEPTYLLQTDVMIATEKTKFTFKTIGSINNAHLDSTTKLKYTGYQIYK